MSGSNQSHSVAVDQPADVPDSGEVAAKVEDTMPSRQAPVDLQRCEEIIKRGMKDFVSVGRALETILQQRLHQPAYRTFGEYCRARWSMSRAQAYRLIGAAHVMEVLSPFGEWRLDKASVFLGFLEAQPFVIPDVVLKEVPWPREQGKGLGAMFHGSGFASAGTPWYQITRQIRQ